jgi:hypothetical protein
MIPSTGPSAVRARVPVGAIVLVVFIFTVVIAGFVVALVFTIFKLMDREPAHICGLSLVQRSPVAIALVGSPIVQHGFTGGRSSSSNSEDYERWTFWVRGPRGDAFVVSEGHRSPLGSHLLVRIGRSGAGQTIYSGPFDCAELHH